MFDSENILQLPPPDFLLSPAYFECSIVFSTWLVEMHTDIYPSRQSFFRDDWTDVFNLSFPLIHDHSIACLDSTRRHVIYMMRTERDGSWRATVVDLFRWRVLDHGNEKKNRLGRSIDWLIDRLIVFTRILQSQSQYLRSRDRRYKFISQVDREEAGRTKIEWWWKMTLKSTKFKFVEKIN